MKCGNLQIDPVIWIRYLIKKYIHSNPLKNNGTHHMNHFIVLNLSSLSQPVKDCSVLLCISSLHL